MQDEQDKINNDGTTLTNSKKQRENKKGKVIVLEGLDKSGKTTQSRLIYDYYNSIFPGEVFLFDFPDYSTRIGKEIKLFLEGKVSYSNEVKHILLSANRWEKKTEIESLKNSKKIIILNRYYQSNLAYGLSNGMDLDWLMNLDKGLPKEDLVIILDIDSAVSQKRGTDNRFELDEFEENLQFLENVRKNYNFLAEKFNWNIINSNREVNDVFNSILDVVDSSN
ncbi:MAG: dTMP kinase [Thermoproteota archaeon]|nr:dTMP kinase [Thermoproteota archaeon]